MERDVLGQRAHRTLGGVVVRGGSEPAAGPEDRAVVDHRCVVGGLECLPGDLHPEEDARLVDGHVALVLLERDVLDRAEAAGAGVVEQDVQPAVLGHRALHGPLPVLGRGHVVVLVGRLAPQLAQVGHHLLPVGVGDVGDEHLRALLAQPVDRGPADPVRAAGDQGHPALESSHPAPPRGSGGASPLHRPASCAGAAAVRGR